MAEIFNGNSRYSSDFQAIIERSVALASLPLTSMQQSRMRTNDESVALDAVDSKVAAVRNTVTAIEASLDSQLTTASSSDTAIASVSMSAGALEGSYTLKVTNIGAYSTSTSGPGTTTITDITKGTLADATQFTLAIDVDTADAGNALVPITLNPASKTLKALVEEINAKAGQYVQATVVNYSTTSTPDYRLSLQSKKLGANGFKLVAGSDVPGGTDLLTAGSTTGWKAQYELNGVVRSAESRTVQIAPSVTVDLKKQDATAVTTITVAKSTGALQGALNSFVSAYNAAITEVDKNRVKGAALAGSSMLTTITETMRNAGGFEGGTGYYKSMADIGLLFDRNGKLYLDSTILNAAPKDSSKDRIAEIKTLIGTVSGGGFAKAAANVFDSLSGVQDSSRPRGGMLKETLDYYKASLDNQDRRIEAEQERIDELTRSLQAKMAEADAMIGMLEQQASYFTGMFEAMRAASKGN